MSQFTDTQILDFVLLKMNKKRKVPLDRKTLIEEMQKPAPKPRKESSKPRQKSLTKNEVADYLLDKYKLDIDIVKAEIKQVQHEDA